MENLAPTPGDRYELSRTIDYLQSFTGDTPPRTPDNPILEERNLATLPGALYFRFGVRVKSRYAPLIHTDSELDTLLSQNSQASERWRRTLVPCRLLSTLPKPSLRLVVPLTAALAPSDPSVPSTPPLAVLFNDRWYRNDLAGLAEQLEGEILQVALPEAGAGKIAEFGFDPALYRREPLRRRDSVSSDADRGRWFHLRHRHQRAALSSHLVRSASSRAHW